MTSTHSMPRQRDAPGMWHAAKPEAHCGVIERRWPPGMPEGEALAVHVAEPAGEEKPVWQGVHAAAPASLNVLRYGLASVSAA
jgi:hypothetical protein